MSSSYSPRLPAGTHVPAGNLCRLPPGFYKLERGVLRLSAEKWLPDVGRTTVRHIVAGDLFTLLSDDEFHYRAIIDCQLLRVGTDVQVDFEMIPVSQAQQLNRMGHERSMAGLSAYNHVSAGVYFFTQLCQNEEREWYLDSVELAHSLNLHPGVVASALCELKRKGVVRMRDGQVLLRPVAL